MKLKKHNIESQHKYVSEDKDGIILKTLYRGDVKQESYSFQSFGDRIDKINNLLVEDGEGEIKNLLPADYGYSTIRVQVDVDAKDRLYHLDHFVEGWRFVLSQGYECDIKELAKEYKTWFDGFIYEAYTKSEALKGWNAEGGIGERIHSRLRNDFTNYLDEKYFKEERERQEEIRWEERRRERELEEQRMMKEVEERKSVFDVIDEIGETIEDEQTEEVEEVNV